MRTLAPASPLSLFYKDTRVVIPSLRSSGVFGWFLPPHALLQLNQRRLIHANQAATGPVKIEHDKSHHHDQEAEAQHEAPMSRSGLAQRMAGHRPAKNDRQPQQPDHGRRHMKAATPFARGREVDYLIRGRYDGARERELAVAADRVGHTGP